ncbi:MAG: FHA domain-containing protein [Pseudomonadota bacterium]
MLFLSRRSGPWKRLNPEGGRGPFILGRDPGCDFVVDDPTRALSRLHLQLERFSWGYEVRVIGAAGVNLNGKYRSTPAYFTLKTQDVLSFAGTKGEVFRLFFGREPPATAPERRGPFTTGGHFSSPSRGARDDGKPATHDGAGAAPTFPDLAHPSPAAPSPAPSPPPPPERATAPPASLAPVPITGQEVLIPRREGRVLFRVARTMWSETAELAEVRLSPDAELPVHMRAELERTMVGRGLRTEEHPVEPLGPKMTAALHGDERFFRIKPLSSAVQRVEADAVGWDWQVTPLREGRSLLTLRLSMVVDDAFQEVRVDAQALHTTVEIGVRSALTRPARFLRDNWRWVLGGSGIGAASGILAWFG